MRVRALRLLIVCAAVVAVSTGGATAATAGRAHAARSLPKLATGWHPAYSVRPHTIYYTGDGSGLIGRIPGGAHAVGKQPGFLHWTRWNYVTARAVGTVWVKSCLPNCVASPFRRYSLTLTATLPRNGRFSTLTLHYSYAGKRVTDVRCDSGHGYYDLPPDWPRSNDCVAPQ